MRATVDCLSTTFSKGNVFFSRATGDVFPNLHGQSAFPKAWCFPKTLLEPLRGFIGLWVFLRRVCFRIWDIRIPETSYVLSRESVFQLRHRSHVRIPPKPRTARFRLNAPFAATYPLERNTRFARDCRPFFNKILREGRFARDCRPFFNNIPKRQRFARDRRRFSQPTRPIGPSKSMVLSQNTRGTFKGFHWTLGFLTACVFSNFGYGLPREDTYCLASEYSK